MAIKNLKIKGISTYASRFNILGIHLSILGILLGVLRERRIFEAMWGAVCFIFCRPSAIPTTVKSEMPPEQYLFAHCRIVVSENISFTCREQAISTQKQVSVIGEYGWPGARIAYLGMKTKVYDPYLADNRVYHIHSLTHFKDDLFLVATGDTAKYLDVLKINEDECIIVKRLLKYLGGFTASIRLNQKIWFGTDFSNRPNYLYCLNDQRKYFLPQAAYTEIVLCLNAQPNETIEIITKQHQSINGHRLTFNSIKRIFEDCAIVELSEYSTLPEKLDSQKMRIEGCWGPP